MTTRDAAGGRHRPRVCVARDGGLGRRRGGDRIAGGLRLLRDLAVRVGPGGRQRVSRDRDPDPQPPTPTPCGSAASTGATIGSEMDQLRQASGGPNGIPVLFVGLGTLVESALYRYDARDNAIPDLADGPCVAQGADGTVIRCRLVETTFHDGTPLTADDVAFTYALFQRPASINAWMLGSLKNVRAVEPRTVDFVLSAADATFMTMVLPSIPILPRHAVEAAYADFVAATKDLTAADLTKLADTIDEEAGRDPPVCETRLDEVASLLSTIGARLYREDFSRETGRFESCTYMGAASTFIRLAATALETAADPGADALDAVAAAFQLLWTDWEPIGTGPYRFVSEDADRVHLEAWPGYHGGLAATRYVDFVPTRADGSDLVAGTVDFLQFAGVDTAYRVTVASRGVRFATLISGGFLGLQINVRPGRLFADVNLRQALQLCIDLPRDVDAATGGVNAPVYGPVIPGSWADDPDLPKPTRDTAAATRLIEGAGWQLGTDGIYAKDGVRLAAQIPVREGMSDRGMMADLVASQARECGMDLQSRPMSFDEMLEMLNRYPHILPGTTTPFELYLGAWSTAIDPDDGLSIFVSSAISDAEHPDNVNFGGFSDPAFDALVAAGRATYDQAERTRIYREAQQELAAQVPYIFFWGFVLPDCAALGRLYRGRAARPLGTELDLAAGAMGGGGALTPQGGCDERARSPGGPHGPRATMARDRGVAGCGGHAGFTGSLLVRDHVAVRIGPGR